MKTTITTAVAAMVMATSFAVPSAHAMQQELNALTGAIYNELSNRQMDLAGIQDLTLRELNQISLIMNGGDGESEKRRKIDVILRKASGLQD